MRKMLVTRLDGSSEMVEAPTAEALMVALAPFAGSGATFTDCSEGEPSAPASDDTAAPAAYLSVGATNDAPASVRTDSNVNGTAPSSSLLSADTRSTFANPVVNASGQVRADRDTQDFAAAFGGNVGGETFFAHGTKLADSGVETATKERLAWERRPRVGPALASLGASIVAERRADLDASLKGSFANAEQRTEIVSRSRLAFTRTGQCVIEGNGTRYNVRPHALRQLLLRLGVTGSVFFDNLARLDMQSLIATNLNHLLAARLGDDVVCRVRTTARGPEIFAVLTEKYNAFDGDKVAQILSDSLGGTDMRAVVNYDETRCAWRAEISAHTTVAPENLTVGEAFRTYIVVRGWDDGSGGISGYRGGERIRCLNCTLLDATGGEWSITHLADPRKLQRKVRDEIRAAETALRPFLERWGFACKERVMSAAREANPDAPVSIEQAMPGFYRAILTDNRELLKVSGEKHVRAMVQAWEREPGDTRAAVVNGLTRWAHETAGPWMVDPAAKVAAQILASRRPFSWEAEAV